MCCDVCAVHCSCVNCKRDDFHLMNQKALGIIDVLCLPARKKVSNISQ